MTDLTIKIQLTLYEYADNNQSSEIINMNTLETDPKLEIMLKMWWKIEQRIEILTLKALDDKSISYNDPIDCENKKSLLKHLTNEITES